ncbi:MAG: SDR family oxidoreductase [Thiohalomonadales bacterium]
MVHTTIKQKIPLILTSNGKTGRRVVERFRSSGLDFREGSRHSAIPFDWYDSTTWQNALHGVSSVYSVFYPDLAISVAREIITDFTKVAVSCGVEHLVLLSGRGEEEAQACEKIVMNSTLDWTIVRSSWFAQNFSEHFFLGDILRGQLVVPVGDIKEPFIDAEDIADVVFAALTDEKHKNQIYEITGPALMTFREVIHEIAVTTNRNIDFQQVSMDDYVALLSQAEVPGEFITLIKYLFTEVLDGRNSHVTEGIKLALGREPRSFHSYAQVTAETGIWNPVESNESLRLSAMNS